jgi:hypothetical protein
MTDIPLEAGLLIPSRIPHSLSDLLEGVMRQQGLPRQWKFVLTVMKVLDLSILNSLHGTMVSL